MKDTNFNVNEYLPLRDVVFNTLRQAIITGEFAGKNSSEFFKNSTDFDDITKIFFCDSGYLSAFSWNHDNQAFQF